ncbi:MAG: hypothetical protein GX564_07480 [Oligosphaeraceae bacterium]|nr:hypothetical protein [Oligosphaeraceae bacterium]
MELLFLGTGAADWLPPGPTVGNHRRHCSLLLNQQILLDCNAMTLDALQEFAVDCSRISHIVIGHSHSDHFDFDSICTLASQPRSTALTLHLEAGSAQKFPIPDGLSGNLQLQPFTTGEEFTVGAWQFQPDAANHPMADPQEQAVHFLLQDPDGKTLLYLLDGGWPPEKTCLRWQHTYLNVIIWELTVGIETAFHIFSHCNAQMLAILETAFRQRGMIDANTLQLCSHLARRFCPPQPELQRQLQPYPFRPAYDGMKISC